MKVFRFPIIFLRLGITKGSRMIALLGPLKACVSFTLLLFFVLLFHSLTLVHQVHIKKGVSEVN